MTIEQRLERLERQNTWMRRAGALLFAGVACVVLMGQGKAQAPPDLVAKSLRIVDANGNTLIKLHTAHTTAPILNMHDPNARTRMSLQAHHLRFMAKDGVRRVTLGTVGDDAYVLGNDDKGKVIWQAPSK